MNPQWKKFAPFGLYVALLAILVTFGLFIVFQKFELPVQISIAIAVFGFAVYGILDPDNIRRKISGRQAKYGSNALVLTVAFSGILIVVNYLGFSNTKNWDLTQDKQNTLAPETLQIIGALPNPVFAEAYFSPDIPSEQARGILEQLKSAAKGKFDYKFYNPRTDPVRAMDAKVTRDGTIVLKMSDRSEQAQSSEQELATALLRLTNPGKRAIYFLTGHGEIPLDGAADQSLALLKTSLEGKNYTVNSLNLLTDTKIPEDALVIIIARPMKPLLDKEVTLIKSFLSSGKGLIYLNEPSVFTQFGTQPDTLANYLTETWGAKYNNDLIIDPSLDPVVLVTGDPSLSKGHPVAEKLINIGAVMYTARSIQLAKTAPADISQTQLLISSFTSWGETDSAGLANNKVNKDTTDNPAPLNIAVALENSTNQGRVILFGDVDFAMLPLAQELGNLDLAINAIDWSARQENLLNLSPKTTTKRVLIPPTIINMGIILLITVFVLPGSVVATGIIVWMTRRRKG